jgi:Mannosyltransferase (PIG-M)
MHRCLCDHEDSKIHTDQRRNFSRPRRSYVLRVSISLAVGIFASCAANGVIYFFFAVVASWGYPFIHETYLYHLHRLDHRHNFSPYFYQIYLTHPGISASAVAKSPVWRKILRSPLTSFLTQLILSLSSGLFFIRTRQDMIMGWFTQTATFVIFNKVCTSQVCATLPLCYVKFPGL